MITALVTVFAALAIPGLVILLVAARRAPVGFEDAAGFHAIDAGTPAHGVIGATLSAH